MNWQNHNAFHKASYRERRPDLWRRAAAVGVTGDMSLLETVAYLLDYIDGLKERVGLLELERDLR